MEKVSTIKDEINFNSRWKDSLKSLYELGSLSITSGFGEEAVAFLFDSGSDLGAKLSFFISSCKLDLTELSYEDLSKQQFEIYTVHELIRRLSELELVKKRESGSYTVIDGPRTHGEPICEYTLSEKGLDTVLKLIEHDDNKERFITQTNISRLLKRNSNISVGVSILAFCVAVYGTSLSFKRLTILEDSLIDKAKIEQIQPVAKAPTQAKKINTDTNQ